jgi:dolichol-phosphate mannosyltransferase
MQLPGSEVRPGPRSPKVSVLMPVRNEGVNATLMLRILTAVLEAPHEILIVYDSPADDTVAALQQIQPAPPSLRLIHNDLGPGVANAIKAGVRAAVGENVLIFAVDEIGPVLAIDDMLALMDEGCDLVSCTRYAHGGRRLGGSLVGGLLSRAANRLIRLLTGSALTDWTTGIKMFRRSLLDEIHLEARPVGWAVTFELAVKVQAAGLKVGEVPIVSIDRLYGGHSTFALGPWFVEYLRWFLWGLLALRRTRRVRTREVLVRLPSHIVGSMGAK